MSTLDYYNKNADAFFTGTVNADVSDLYANFEPLLPPHAHILDIGCGSGRDSKHFLNAGFTVTAIDGSVELCNRASQMLGIPVKHMLFQDIAFESEFDAAWACASLVHVPKNEIPDIIRRIAMALKPRGVFYASFKYGTSERESGGRHFSDYTENSVSSLTAGAPDLSLHDYWVSSDVRPTRAEEKWLNIIWIKRAR